MWKKIKNVENSKKRMVRRKKRKKEKKRVMLSQGTNRPIVHLRALLALFFLRSA